MKVDVNGLRCLKKQLAERPLLTDEERAEIFRRHVKAAKLSKFIDWEDFHYHHDARRLAKQLEAKAKRLPRTAKMEERLFALAGRLGIPPSYYQSLEADYDDHFGHSDAQDRLWAIIGRSLGMLQPGFWTSRRGRPKGRPNKQLSTTANKDTVRKRHQRARRRAFKLRWD
jgi:hypothetical protein